MNRLCAPEEQTRASSNVNELIASASAANNVDQFALSGAGSLFRVAKNCATNTTCASVVVCGGAYIISKLGFCKFVNESYAPLGGMSVPLTAFAHTMRLITKSIEFDNAQSAFDAANSATRRQAALVLQDTALNGMRRANTCGATIFALEGAATLKRIAVEAITDRQFADAIFNYCGKRW